MHKYYHGDHRLSMSYFAIGRLCWTEHVILVSLVPAASVTRKSNQMHVLLFKIEFDQSANDVYN